MNIACLVGRLTKDPELRTTTSGISTCTFTIAVDHWNSSTNQNEADFIQIVAWRNTADNVCKYCKKGSQVAVNGRISSRSYDAQDGTKRYVTEVVANNVTFVGGKNGSAPSSEESGTDYGMSSSSEVEPMDLAEDPYKDFGSEVTLSDDDLPF